MKVWFGHRLLTISLILLTTVSAWGKGSDKVKFPGGRCYMFRLTLTDKSQSPFSLERPQEFLSERALHRRRRQGIAVDSTDLPVSPFYIAQIEARGIEVVNRSRWNNTLLVRAKRQDELRALARLDFVSSAVKVWTSPDSIERRPERVRYHTEFTRWYTLQPTYHGVAHEQIAMLGGVKLHERGYSGRGMMIAVLDGGFMNADVIPALKRVDVAGWRDFATPRAKDIYKETEHGTMVLSTMAMRDREVFVGTAPDATYWLLRTETNDSETQAEEDSWAEAVEFADSAGVDVINSSLGYHEFDDVALSYRYRQLDGEQSLISHTASLLARKGIILVNSAGNDGMGTWKKINFPADARDIITVGAVSADRLNAAFSAVGPTADGRVKPDVMALGSPTTVVTGRGTISKDIGTSFAAPQVAGLVACLWQALPQKTALEIMELVRRSADNADCPDNIFGYGIPDFWKAYTNGRQSESSINPLAEP